MPSARLTRSMNTFAAIMVTASPPPELDGSTLPLKTNITNYKSPREDYSEEKNRGDIEPMSEKDVPVSALSALLDFYSDRATAFASLFVASIFGLVTLSAIIQNYIDGNFYWYIISLFPFIGFAVSGYFTWYRFCFWADMAHKMEYYGIRLPFKSKLKKIFCDRKVEGKWIQDNLYKTIHEEGEKQKSKPVKLHV